MSRKVYKYPVVMENRFTLALPEKAEVLSVGVQFGQPQVWVFLDPNAPKVVRTFMVASTGYPVEEPNVKFIGTFQLEGGALIFHLFEVLG